MSDHYTDEDVAAMSDPRAYLQGLKDTANKATPGPWRVGEGRPGEVWADIGASWNSHMIATTETRLNADLLDSDLANTDHIAAADPPTVTALADALLAVLELHTRHPSYGYCEECGLNVYPCPTVCAITERLTGEGT